MASSATSCNSASVISAYAARSRPLSFLLQIPLRPGAPSYVHRRSEPNVSSHPTRPIPTAQIQPRAALQRKMSIAVVFKPGGESSSKSAALPSLPQNTFAGNARRRQSHSRLGFRRRDRHRRHAVFRRTLRCLCHDRKIPARQSKGSLGPHDRRQCPILRRPNHVTSNRSFGN